MSHVTHTLTVLLVSLLIACTPRAERAERVDTLEAGQTGLLSFPSRHVEGFRDLLRGPMPLSQRTVGHLFLPSSQDQSRPVCAMVILHGSGGEWSGRGKRHAEFLADNGVAAFVVDTFEGRGLTKSVRYIERLRHVNLPDQIADAYAALHLLSTHPDIDPDCIGVMGYSLGGMSTFLTAVEDIANRTALSPLRFTLHVPFYAPCAFRPIQITTTGAPIIAFWGTLDITTERETCEAFAQDFGRDKSEVSVHWFKGAAHGWNGLNPPKHFDEIPRVVPCQFIIQEDGTLEEQTTGRTAITDTEMIDVLGACTAFGYTLGYHEPTDRETKRLLLQAIRNVRN